MDEPDGVVRYGSADDGDGAARARVYVPVPPVILAVKLGPFTRNPFEIKEPPLIQTWAVQVPATTHWIRS